MTRRFLAFVDGLSRAAAVAATALLAAAMLVVCQMIFMRYVFRAPTIWQTDFVVFSATAAVFLGAPYVLREKGHVGVDVVQTVVRPRVWHALSLAGHVLGLIFCLGMTVASLIYFLEAWEGGWRTSSVASILLWPPLLPLPLGFALLSLQAAAQLVRAGGEGP